MRRFLVGAIVLGGVISGASPASAGGLRFERHPRPATTAPKPAGVPLDYVFTHNGFFHPSCVVRIAPDEVWGRDSVIRGKDGSVHEVIPPCPYPRYTLGGQPLPPGAAATARQRARASASLDVPHAGGGGGNGGYDGWLTWYDTNPLTTLDPGSTLVTEWIVPDLPTNVGQQDVAFFNDFETKDIILQPVLDFSEAGPVWAIESENCCGPSGNGNDVQSTLVNVSPGDLIRGEVDVADCDSSGVCSNWTVTTTDVTTGGTTQLTMQNPGEEADEVNPGVLETYSITSCDMFPANGETQFFNNTLTTSKGVAEPETYTLETIILDPPSAGNGPASGFPMSCGYSGTASGNDYTLIYGASPTPVAPNPLPDGGAPPITGADAGGVGVDAGGPPEADGGSGSGSGSGGGSSGGSSGSSSGSGAGSGGSSGGTGSGSGSGAASDVDSGSGGGNMESNSPGSSLGDGSSGCGCATVGASQGTTPLALALAAIALAVGARRKRSA